MNAVKKHSMVTEQCPDTIEWCPTEEYRDIFVCGTYQLLEQHSSSLPAHLIKRTGSLLLYRLNETEIDLLGSTSSEAILDCKWFRNNKWGKSILASVDAKGQLIFYYPQNDAIGTKLNQLCCVNVSDKSLALSLDLEQSDTSTSGSKVCVSGSDGSLSFLEFSSSNVSLLRTWKCHEFEAWITAFNRWDHNVVYSGGDDCKFCGWDLREGSSPIFMNSVHQAGVCSIQSSFTSENIIATGSYDEFIRLWDVRCVRRKPFSETFVGGGIWRIKWHPLKKGKMLAACMYNGFKVLDFGDDAPSEPISFNAKEGSLAYGADWHVMKKNLCSSHEHELDVIATCTFYDRNLNVWNLCD